MLSQYCGEKNSFQLAEFSKSSTSSRAIVNLCLDEKSTKYLTTQDCLRACTLFNLVGGEWRKPTQILPCPISSIMASSNFRDIEADSVKGGAPGVQVMVGLDVANTPRFGEAHQIKNQTCYVDWHRGDAYGQHVFCP